MKPVKVQDVAVFDFESLPIEKGGRPSYPPEPVGCSILLPTKKPIYYAWGHPEGNTHSWETSRQALGALLDSGRPVACHNAKFDLAVACEKLDLKMPADELIHDTLLMLFLDDPRQASFELKPSAERLLGLPPEERDELMDWVISQQPIQGKKLGRAKGPNYAGAYVAWAPVDLVSRYANGDCVKTQALLRHLMPSLQDRDMLGAYERERALLPIVMEMEKQGVPVDLARLRADVFYFTDLKVQIDTWVRKKLRSPGLNIDSDAEVAARLLELGLMDQDLMLRTPSGKLSMSKESLELAVNDKQVHGMLRYRAALSTCLGTFMIPWLETAEQSGGLIYTSWNTTRNAAGEVGTKTGRLSSTPNFQNIPNEFKAIWQHDVVGDDTASTVLRASLPRAPFQMRPLPLVRSYVIPFEGDVLVDRDYSQQEPRIAAHYEEGPLYQGYKANPWLDVHDHTKALVDEATGKDWKRKPIKNTGLGILYGMGKDKLALKNGMEPGEANDLKKLVLKLVYPGIADMYKEMKRKAKAGEPIRTWGGREYYCEEPKVVNGRLMHFDYKMVNLLIQGSAADATKQALINYHRAKPKDHKLILQVHDQLTASVPKSQLRKGHELMRREMESIDFDIPLLTEGKYSFTNWQDGKDYDKKGVIIYANRP